MVSQTPETGRQGAETQRDIVRNASSNLLRKNKREEGRRKGDRGRRKEKGKTRNY